MSLADDLRNLRDIIKKISVIDSKDIRAIKSGDGTKLYISGSVSGSGSGGSTGTTAALVKITSGTTLDGYTVDIYENSFSGAAIGSASCDVFPLAIGANLPVGFELLAFSSAIRRTGGSE